MTIQLFLIKEEGPTLRQVGETVVKYAAQAKLKPATSIWRESFMKVNAKDPDRLDYF